MQLWSEELGGINVLTASIWKSFVMQEKLLGEYGFFKFYADISETNEKNSEEELVTKEDNNFMDDTEIERNPSDY